MDLLKKVIPPAIHIQTTTNNYSSKVVSCIREIMIRLRAFVILVSRLVWGRFY